MTTPTITFEHGYLTDCGDSTLFVATDSGLGATLTVTGKDIFDITGTPNAAGDEYGYWSYPSEMGGHTTHLTLSTALYLKVLVRWKTSLASGGLGARVQLVFSDTTTQDLLEVTGIPQFSTAWKVKVVTLTAGKTIDHIRLWADDYPDNCASAASHVYYDFVLICAGIFTFPNCESSRWEPKPKYGITSMPARTGDDIQNLGSNGAQFHCICNLDLSNTTDDWKRPQGNLIKTGGDVIPGQVFDEIAHRSYVEPWQWLNTGKNRQFKAILENPFFDYPGEKHTLDLLFTEKRVTSGSNETYVERFGLNL